MKMSQVRFARTTRLKDFRSCWPKFGIQYITGNSDN